MSEPLYPLLALSRLRMGIDGRGVTTLVAGAGCPLACRYCINRRLLQGQPRPVTARQLLEQVKLDELYFLATGGGLCFGGGEALLHTAFYARLRQLLPQGWRLTAETSLHVSPGAVEQAAETIDEFIVDIKDWDPEIYRAYTGGDGRLMQENLRRLLALAGPERIRLRLPRIPEFNGPEDQARSRRALEALGFLHFDCFSYVVRPEK